MIPPVEAASQLTRDIEKLTDGRVRFDPRRVLDRSDSVRLSPPGLISANGACRLLRASDAWIALNLARAEDRDLVPAWSLSAADGANWPAIARYVAKTPSQRLRDDARLLGLPFAIVGEATPSTHDPDTRVRTEAPPMRSARLKVVDLSALWAGPLCGAVLAAAGADVIKVESVHRPDRRGTPHAERLNAGKRRVELDFRAPPSLRALHEEIASAGILITSARPHALARLGLTRGRVFARNPDCIWIAITGYGWQEGDRVAFGDDAAAAGACLWADESGRPSFAGDAIADPLTGLAAAASGLRALAEGGGRMVDAAMARCAAGFARMERLAA